MSDKVTIILDDLTMNGQGAGVFHGDSPSSFNDTVLGFDSGSSSNSLQLSFRGTSIAFIGGASLPSTRKASSSSFDIQIQAVDNSFTRDDTGRSYPSTDCYCQWYTSPSLPDSSTVFNIDATNLRGVDIDYALIEVGENTPLAGQTIIVDDLSPEIRWEDGWFNQSDFEQLNNPKNHMHPNGNSTHSSTTAGSGFEFRFAGTSIAAVGMLFPSNGDSFTAIFNVDDSDQPFTRKFNASDVTTHQNNFVFFNQSTLSSGNHTLTVNLTETVGAAVFAVDYLLYRPTFGSLSGKPDFGTFGLQGNDGGSDGGDDGGNTTGNGSESTPSGSSSSKTNVGAIAGGVVGGVVFLLLAIGLLWFRRRKQSTNTRVLKPRPNSDFVVSPLAASPSSGYPASSSRNEKGGYNRETIAVSPATGSPSQADSHAPAASSNRMEEMAALHSEIERQRSILSRTRQSQMDAAPSPSRDSEAPQNPSSSPETQSPSEGPRPTAEAQPSQDQIVERIDVLTGMLTRLMNDIVAPPPAYQSETRHTSPASRFNPDAGHGDVQES